MMAVKKIGGVAAVGKLLGVSRRTVFNLEKIGLPKLGPGKYDLGACERWYADYSAREGMPAEVSVQRTRWLKAKADREEIQLAKDRAEVAPLAVTAKLWEGAIQACRAKFLSLPHRLAPVVVGLNSTAEIFTLLQEAIYEALDELADPAAAGKVMEAAFPGSAEQMKGGSQR
jgi:phage terminase Nu1 subunit (DNA packaging protein)